MDATARSVAGLPRCRPAHPDDPERFACAGRGDLGQRVPVPDDDARCPARVHRRDAPAARRFRAAGWVAAMAVSACTAAPPTAAPAAREGASAAATAAPPASATQRAAAALDAAIGAAVCRDDADCATVGVGALACGGPQAWRAWSRRDADAATVTRLAAAHRAAREADIARSGEMSVCRVVPDPGAHCVRPSPQAAAGRCQPYDAARGGDARLR